MCSSAGLLTARLPTYIDACGPLLYALPSDFRVTTFREIKEKHTASGRHVKGGCVSGWASELASEA
jgi:hypothetical protein